jgi:hypothetical protein
MTGRPRRPRYFLADEKQEGKRVGQADLAEFGRGGECDVRVAALQRAL